jgi:SAM-dependent methyltransferase
MNQQMFQKDYWELKRSRRSPDHKVIEAFIKPKIEFIENKLGDLSQYKLLDVGCGNGFFTNYFDKKSFTVGMDFSQYMLSINPSPIKLQGSALQLPFKDKSFDIVFCSNLLHHLQDSFIAVMEMARVSKSYVILSEPNRNNPLMLMFCFLKRAERGGLKFSRDYLRHLALQAQCCVIGEVTLGMILPNVTPIFLLPFLNLINQPNPLGFFNLIIVKVPDS